MDKDHIIRRLSKKKPQNFGFDDNDDDDAIINTAAGNFGTVERNAAGYITSIPLGERIVCLKSLIFLTHDPRLKKFQGLVVVRDKYGNNEYAVQNSPKFPSAVLEFDVIAENMFDNVNKQKIFAGLKVIRLKGFTGVRYNSLLDDGKEIPEWLMKQLLREAGSANGLLAKDDTKNYKLALRRTIESKSKKKKDGNAKSNMILPACLRLINEREVIEDLSMKSHSPFIGRYADLLKISTVCVNNLYLIWKSSPLKLCFTEFCVGLKPTTLRLAFSHDMTKMETWHEKTLSLYSRLYNSTFQGKSSFLTTSDIDVPECGVKYLKEIGILASIKGYYCLRNIYEIEETIAHCIADFREQGPELCEKYHSQDEEKIIGFNFCDEQKRAWEALKSVPILLIQGSAGSGKTLLSQALGTKYFGRPLGATFQGINSGPLQKAFGPGMSQTAHRLIYSHIMEHEYMAAAKAKSSSAGWRSSDSFDMPESQIPDKCIFSEVDTLVIDEAGNMSTLLFAHLLSAFVTCSNSPCKRLVMVGDKRQIGSIGMCSSFEPLCVFFNKYGLYSEDDDEKKKLTFGAVVEFTHNHRTGDDSLVCENARAVAINNPTKVQIIPSWFEIIQPYGINGFSDAIIKFLQCNPSWNEENTIIMTRTNEVRRELLKRLETFYAFTIEGRVLTEKELVIGLNRKRKFAFGKNFWLQSLVTGSVNTINNEILILEWIGYVNAEDVPDLMLKPHEIPPMEEGIQNTHEINKQQQSTFTKRRRKESPYFSKSKPTQKRKLANGTGKKTAFESFFASSSPSSSSSSSSRSSSSSQILGETDIGYSAGDLSRAKVEWETRTGEKVLFIYFSTASSPKKYRACTWEFALSVFPKRASVMTVNAAQGSEFENGIYVITKDSHFETCSSVYTSITRSRKVMVVGNRDHFNRAVRREQDKRRSLLILHLSTLLLS